MGLARVFGVTAAVLATAGVGMKLTADVRESSSLVNDYVLDEQCAAKNTVPFIHAKEEEACTPAELKAATRVNANERVNALGSVLLTAGALTGLSGAAGVLTSKAVKGTANAIRRRKENQGPQA